MDQADQLILEQLERKKPSIKQCRVCRDEFDISADDLSLLKKLIVPVPTECPECNHRHRLCWRNERNLYKRKCDATGKDIISNYSPDKPYKIYDKDYWYSDQWDPMVFGRDYDPGVSFLEQLNDLMSEAPYPNLMWSNSENSDYTNHAADNKNCYMISTAGGAEDCYFGKGIIYSKNCVDCFKIEKCEDCYECVFGVGNNSCKYLVNSRNCYNCHFSDNLTGCRDCILSNNLRNKQYCIRNKQVTKEEFDTFVAENSFEKLKSEFLANRKERVVKFAEITNCENSTGNYIGNSKNGYMCFGGDEYVDCRYCWDGNAPLLDSYYLYSSGWGAQLQYNSAGCARSYKLIGCNLLFTNSRDCSYCHFCNTTNNCFGCVSLTNKEYCILNKQYSPGEYEKLVEQIKLNMLDTGEYGEYFLIGNSHYGYNETIAQEFFPLSKEEALKQGFKWSDYDPDSGYDGPWYEPNSDVNYYKDESHSGDLLQGVLRCIVVTGRPYRIIGPELAFYLKHNIPIPKKSPDQRHEERFGLVNPYQLWHRQCMCEEVGHGHEGRCRVEFETSYAPERSEKVYCEGCYQKVVL
ncbi:hypothetical protein KJ855_00180 [Patescibacteria group bacterium]|nr:hypothetical protein [Patescibacteria group bacterium]